LRLQILIPILLASTLSKPHPMEFLQRLPQKTGKIKFPDLSFSFDGLWQRSYRLLERLKTIGLLEKMDDYERRKLGIFNQLNFLQLITGILMPFVGWLRTDGLPATIWLTACLPAVTSVLILYLNHKQKHEAALLSYFVLYPFLTCIVYLKSINPGIELSFIFYGILSVFFLKDMGYMLFSVAWSMINFFILAVVLKFYLYHLATLDKPLYMFNQVMAVALIFYGLYLIKKENAGYQKKILTKNRALHKVNLEIQKQNEEIAEKAGLLKSQAAELTELNSLKNKLLSAIAHDLKAPMYALRNLFNDTQKYNVPADELKKMLPEVVKDLNYTVSLMENLLQWAKSQMHAEAIKTGTVDISKSISEVLQILRLQAEEKKIFIESKVAEPVFVFADKEMINLVLRNLLSNAIKFTPEHGSITLGATELSSFVEIFIQDTGLGLTSEALEKINKNDFFTTKGTASESGTGLGLMLCKEFLNRNGGQMHIESAPGKGSIFSFTLPKPCN
jgi:two-component system, sensor histidine kinase and response regulator